MTQPARRHLRATLLSATFAGALGCLLPVNGAVMAQTALSFEEIVLLAENGNTDAQLTLGAAYSTGDGVEQDFATAARWLETAADAGSAQADYELARLGLEGLLTDADPVGSLSHLERSAEAGYPPAQHALAGFLLAGDTVSDTDRDAAIAWYERASEAGLAEAATRLGVIYQSGDILPANLSAARAWYERGMALGDPSAFNNLAVMHIRGQGVEQDYDRAAELLQPAVGAGLPEAMRNLGSLYESGFGVPLDEEKAKALYRAASEQSRQRRTTAALAADDAIPASPADLKRAALSGDTNAQSALGQLYLVGRGVPQDYVMAYGWANLAGDESLRETVLDRMTARQIQDGQAMTQRLRERVTTAD